MDQTVVELIDDTDVTPQEISSNEGLTFEEKCDIYKEKCDAKEENYETYCLYVAVKGCFLTELDEDDMVSACEGLASGCLTMTDSFWTTSFDSSFCDNYYDFCQYELDVDPLLSAIGDLENEREELEE